MQAEIVVPAAVAARLPPSGSPVGARAGAIRAGHGALCRHGTGRDAPPPSFRAPKPRNWRSWWPAPTPAGRAWPCSTWAPAAAAWPWPWPAPYPPARVVAVDISAEALAVARGNAARYAPQVEFQQLDILTEKPSGLPPAPSMCW
ncbi:MAG: class I SAM-dependent methyltransferase [Hymenobacter sp.]